jgi:hypothetical protein
MFFKIILQHIFSVFKNHSTGINAAGRKRRYGRDQAFIGANKTPDNVNHKFNPVSALQGYIGNMTPEEP